jgi:predicted nucleic acid-binding protein
LSVYLDSSFVVSLYITDVHSTQARERILAVPSFTLTPLHFAEWVHAVAQQQFWGNLTPEKAQRMQADFLSDRKSGVWHQIGLPEGAFELCVDLAQRHGSRLGVRTLDSLHVACALELKAERFWTFDERQAKLARAEGLKSS